MTAPLGSSRRAGRPGRLRYNRCLSVLLGTPAWLQLSGSPSPLQNAPGASRTQRAPRQPTRSTLAPSEWARRTQSSCRYFPNLSNWSSSKFVGCARLLLNSKTCPFVPTTGQPSRVPRRVIRNGQDDVQLADMGRFNISHFFVKPLDLDVLNASIDRVLQPKEPLPASA
mgnify:CR=1 FL=1